MLLLLTTLGIVFLAEMGDKTQFLLVAMASKYKVKDIMIGTFVAIAVLNALAIALGSAIGKLIPSEYISVIAGLAFFYFAFASLKGEDEEEAKNIKKKLPDILLVFGTFFLAELGDKTQLTALALSAENGNSFLDALLVWIGASIGLYLADMIGMLVGLFLGKKLPEGVFKIISFLVFAVFGVIKVLSGFEGIFVSNKLLAVIISVSLTIIFAGLCAFRIYKLKKQN